MKELKKYNNMLRCIADAHHGIPTRFPCGGRIVDEVSPGKKFPGDFDTLPGRKYFTCENFEVLFRYSGFDLNHVMIVLGFICMNRVLFAG